ncbi:DUF4350 domain-containing protein [Flavobacterium sp. KACC 22761]|uniref:DUF4350 domain-containing protein n=1 Tax=Flavobacterium sp. KACC 22761 TaxID=3092665 RepID=UPI002A75964B|nr:DUF4350 domain-containing protein [Flavobacterium sp. KACC 22761]WPO77131.1 DUF4350 domain-containing protein [Flavobacterium sp. KACC 22761]
MDRSIKIYLGVLVFIFGLILLTGKKEPKPIDWRPTFSVHDKIPYGLFVFNQEINKVLKNQKVERISTVTPYEYLDSKYNPDTLVEDYRIKGTFMNIANNGDIDEQSVKELFYFVSRGNSAFLSMRTFPQILLDSLNLTVKNDLKPVHNTTIWMANPKASKKKYIFKQAIEDYFSKIDTAETTVLGYQSTAKNEKHINFIKVNYNGGSFYLHTQPAAFTNFHLLRNNHYQYVENLLSQIPKGDVFWYTKGQNNETVSGSPLRYIFSQPALKWAYLFGIFGILIFIIFNAKRKQRIVPIVKPLANLTVDFTKTIGNLYYQEGDHTNIIDKKIIFFLEKMRNEYLIDTTKLDDDFIKKLQHKTGKNIADIQELVFLINEHRKSYHGSLEEDLIRINNAIEKVIH